MESSATNHVDWFCYDAAGNLLNPGPCAPQGSKNPYFYDGYGTLLVGNYNFSDFTSYSVDEYERRVAKWQNGAMNHQYLYGIDDNPVAEADGTGNWLQTNVRAGGRLLAEIKPSGITYIHTDHLGTVRAESDSTGRVIMTCTNLPFGDGSNCTSGYFFTGKERDSESGNDYFGARYYGSSMGRFLSPDPMGGHLEYPQSLNKYVYVMDNPLRFTDPTGLDLWLKGCGKDSATCHKNYEGTWGKNHKHFTRTHIKGDQRQNATLGPHGISVKYGGNTYQGVWDTNKGEQNAVDVAGSGALSPFTAEINGNCGGNCVFSGTLYNASGFGTNQQTLASASAVYSALNAKGSGYVRNAGFDAMDFFHPGDVNFRGYSDTDPGLLFSTHVPVPGPNSPDAASWNGYIHADRTFPYDDVVDFSVHTWSVIRSVVPH